MLYSQAACAKTLMPLALSMESNPIMTIPAFFAISALFVLPTYPTLLAAVEIDDTGSTRVGKYVFNHPFLLPGIFTIVCAVSIAYFLVSLSFYL